MFEINVTVFESEAQTKVRIPNFSKDLDGHTQHD